MTLENRPTESRLPAGDDPYVWVDDRKMIVSSVGGVMAPGAWIGVHVNAVRQPIAEEFNFHVEVAEVDGLGRPTSIVQQCSLRMNVSNEPKELLPVDSHLPARAPACYRIKTSITREGFTETRYAYITVPDQILNAEPARTRSRVTDSTSRWSIQDRPTSSLVLTIALSGRTATPGLGATWRRRGGSSACPSSRVDGTKATPNSQRTRRPVAIA